MLMNYRYPALVRGQLGSARSVRPLMVAMQGRAEVEELDFSDAPVAATVYMPQGKTDYRHHRGRLYRAASESGSDEFRTGLDTHMALKIADTCRMVAGKDILPWPRVAIDCLRNVVLARDSFRSVRGEYTKIGEHEWAAMASLPSLGGYEQSDLDRWEAEAAHYVGDLISLDGDLWIPVPEPLLAVIVVDRKMPYPTFVDATVYDSRNDSPKDMPPPFGRRDGFTSSFWNPAARFYSILDMPDLLDSELGGKLGFGNLPWLRRPDIFMPSAFSNGYAEKELDRAARVVVAEVHSLCKGYGFTDVTKLHLRRHMNRVRRLLGEGGLSDEKGDQMLTQMDMIKSWISTIWSTYPSLRGAGELIAMVTDAAAVWGNREISFDVSWTQQQVSAP
ncbi:hypothetical protein OIU34_21200 [Pararhizobium sp. BT-229]|uniref:hypothetical protein n=1 Tax=Pararhizobium sp. BT-229 TaxID=2986923 RepID=UPI0021F77A62|nr:hypothetical protein [Pararhizobium sp. BT-229]MCV9964409.1 hypothetical protein [Pararhizobium sp. BT-229]